MADFNEHQQDEEIKEIPEAIINQIYRRDIPLRIDLDALERESEQEEIEYEDRFESAEEEEAQPEEEKNQATDEPEIFEEEEIEETAEKERFEYRPSLYAPTNDFEYINPYSERAIRPRANIFEEMAPPIKTGSPINHKPGDKAYERKDTYNGTKIGGLEKGESYFEPFEYATTQKSRQQRLTERKKTPTKKQADIFSADPKENGRNQRQGSPRESIETQPRSERRAQNAREDQIETSSRTQRSRSSIKAESEQSVFEVQNKPTIKTSSDKKESAGRIKNGRFKTGENVKKLENAAKLEELASAGRRVDGRATVYAGKDRRGFRGYSNSASGAKQNVNRVVGKRQTAVRTGQKSTGQIVAGEIASRTSVSFHNPIIQEKKGKYWQKSNGQIQLNATPNDIKQKYMTSKDKNAIQQEQILRNMSKFRKGQAPMPGYNAIRPQYDQFKTGYQEEIESQFRKDDSDYYKAYGDGQRDGLRIEHDETDKTQYEQKRSERWQYKSEDYEETFKKGTDNVTGNNVASGNGQYQRNLSGAAMVGKMTARQLNSILEPDEDEDEEGKNKNKDKGQDFEQMFSRSANQAENIALKTLASNREKDEEKHDRRDKKDKDDEPQIPVGALKGSMKINGQLAGAILSAAIPGAAALNGAAAKGLAKGAAKSTAKEVAKKSKIRTKSVYDKQQTENEWEKADKEEKTEKRKKQKQEKNVKLRNPNLPTSLISFILILSIFSGLFSTAGLQFGMFFAGMPAMAEVKYDATGVNEDPMTQAAHATMKSRLEGIKNRILYGTAYGNNQMSPGTFDSPDAWQGPSYNFNDNQIRQIANLCNQENGTANGVVWEACLILNHFELEMFLQPENKYTSMSTKEEGVISMLRNDGWWASAAYYMDNGSASPEQIELVRQVTKGSRAIPVYIDEHDCYGDILNLTKSEAQSLQASRQQKVIHNKYTSTYTFYGIPDPDADPFGYTQEAFNKAQGRDPSKLNNQGDGVVYATEGNNHSATGSGDAASLGPPSKIILVGDSRTEAMHSVMGDCGHVWFYKIGSGWWDGFLEKNEAAIEAAIVPNAAIVIMLGVNDCASTSVTGSYISYLNRKAPEWKAKGARVYYCAITPSRGDDPDGANEPKITNWNQAMQQGLSQDVIYYDPASTMTNWNFADALHYKTETTRELYNTIINYVQNGGASSSTGAQSGPVITAEMFLQQCEAVMNWARTTPSDHYGNHYTWIKYGNSTSPIKPCEDGYISCDRLVARALWELGYQDQHLDGCSGITCGDMGAYLKEKGWLESKNPNDIKPGSVVLVKKHQYARGWQHCFVVVKFDPATWVTDKFDAGHDSRIVQQQPLRNEPWYYYKDDIAVYNIPDGGLTLNGAPANEGYDGCLNLPIINCSKAVVKDENGEIILELDESEREEIAKKGVKNFDGITKEIEGDIYRQVEVVDSADFENTDNEDQSNLPLADPENANKEEKDPQEELNKLLYDTNHKRRTLSDKEQEQASELYNEAIKNSLTDKETGKMRDYSSMTAIEKADLDKLIRDAKDNQKGIVRKQDGVNEELSQEEAAQLEQEYRDKLQKEENLPANLVNYILTRASELANRGFRAFSDFVFNKTGIDLTGDVENGTMQGYRSHMEQQLVAEGVTREVKLEIGDPVLSVRFIGKKREKNGKVIEWTEEDDYQYLEYYPNKYNSRKGFIEHKMFYDEDTYLQVLLNILTTATNNADPRWDKEALGDLIKIGEAVNEEHETTDVEPEQHDETAVGKTESESEDNLTEEEKKQRDYEKQQAEEEKEKEDKEAIEQANKERLEKEDEDVPEGYRWKSKFKHLGVKEEKERIKKQIEAWEKEKEEKESGSEESSTSDAESEPEMTDSETSDPSKIPAEESLLFVEDEEMHDEYTLEEKQAYERLKQLEKAKERRQAMVKQEHTIDRRSNYLAKMGYLQMACNILDDSFTSITEKGFEVEFQIVEGGNVIKEETEDGTWQSKKSYEVRPAVILYVCASPDDIIEATYRADGRKIGNADFPYALLHYYASKFMFYTNYKLSNLVKVNTSDGSGTGGALTGVAREIYMYLHNKGMSDVCIAGILGNFAQETGGGKFENINPDTEQTNGVGYGILQWSGERRTAFENYAKMTNRPKSDLTCQLDYLWDEVFVRKQTWGGVPSRCDEFLRMTDVEEACDFFWAFVEVNEPTREGAVEYEVTHDLPHRKQEALRAYQMMQSGGFSGGNRAVDQNGVMQVPYFNQGAGYYNNGNWEHTDWPSVTFNLNGHTMRQAACGFFSTAMALSYLKGQIISPIEFKENGMYTGNGSDQNIGVFSAQQYGITAHRTNDINEVITALKNRCPVMEHVGAGCGGLFTSGGHYILLIGYTPDGKIAVNDPGHQDNTYFITQALFTPEQMVACKRENDDMYFTIFGN